MQREGELTYYLQDPTNSFTIEAATGIITVANTELLDREVIETFQLLVSIHNYTDIHIHITNPPTQFCVAYI